MRQKRRYIGFLKYFLPYTIVISITVIIITMLLSTMFLRQTGAILQNIQARQLESESRIFSQIQLQNLPLYIETIWNGPISEFLYSTHLPPDRILRAFETLQRMAIGNEYLDSLYIYNQNLGVVSTRYGWEIRRKISDPDLPYIMRHIGEFGLSRYLLRRIQLDGDAGPANYFTIILGSLPSDNKTMYSAFVANISEAKIRKALDSNASSLYSIYIVNNDTENKFLSHPRAELFGTSADEDLRFNSIMKESAREGTVVVRDEEKVRWLASWVDHPEIHWRFIMLAPEQAVYSQIIRLRNTIIVAVAILLSMAVMTSFIISLGMADQDRMLKLRRTFLKAEILWEPEGIVFSHRKLFPGLREICTMAVIIADRDYEEALKENHLFDLETLIEDEMRKLTKRREIISLSDTQFAVLFENGVEGEDPRMVLSELVSKIYQTYHIETGGFYLSGSVSMDRLPLAFQVLWDNLRLDYLRPSRELVEIPLEFSKALLPDLEIPPETGPAAVVSLNFSPLEKAFRLADYNEACRSISDLCSELRKSEDPDLFRGVLSYLKYKLMDILSRKYISAKKFEEIMKQLRQAERLDRLYAALMGAAETFKNRPDDLGERRKLELMEKIKTIIDQRISEKGLGTGIIASEVNLSTNYIRSIFKRLEGCALSDYIGKKRIEYAIKLLEESKFSIREISDRTGFINYSYFFTYFKKYTGKTPTEYRNNRTRIKKS
jgi:AraC-like DNA-binding protein